MVNTKPLLEQKFRTNPTYIFDILHNFLLLYPKKGTVLWDLEIDKEELDNHVVGLQLMLRRFLGYGWIGSVISEPINEDEAWIKVTYTSGPTVWMDEEEEIYAETQKILWTFCQHIQNLFSDNPPGPITPKIGDVNTVKADIGNTEDVRDRMAIDQQAKRKDELDTLCVKWVNRGYMPKDYNYSEFLNENEVTWVSVTAFKRALKDASRRGKIYQDPKTKRYKPKV